MEIIQNLDKYRQKKSGLGARSSPRWAPIVAETLQFFDWYQPFAANLNPLELGSFFRSVILEVLLHAGDSNRLSRCAFNLRRRFDAGVDLFGIYDCHGHALMVLSRTWIVKLSVYRRTKK